jgi:hypothetical protein
MILKDSLAEIFFVLEDALFSIEIETIESRMKLPRLSVKLQLEEMMSSYLRAVSMALRSNG